VLSSFCRLGARWACNEGGILEAQRASPVRLKADTTYYAPPTLDDYPVILRGSKGPIVEQTPAALYALACREGWPDARDRAGAR